jgi:alanyl-tRNA synthetase
VQLRDSEKELDRMKHKLQTSQAGDAINEATEVHGIKVLVKRADGMDAKDLRDFGDKLRDKLGSGILALGSVLDDKVSLIVMVSKDLTQRFHAGKMIKEMAPILGGTGGGKADLAQSGGKDPGKLDAALASIYNIVKKHG